MKKINLKYHRKSLTELGIRNDIPDSLIRVRWEVWTGHRSDYLIAGTMAKRLSLKLSEQLREGRL